MSDEIKFGVGFSRCRTCKQDMSFIGMMDCGRPGCDMARMTRELRKAITPDSLREAIEAMQNGKHGPGVE